MRRFGFPAVLLAILLPASAALAFASIPETRAGARTQVRGVPASAANPAVLAGKRYEFYFTRAVYSDGGRFGRFGRGRGSWSTDWPKADIQFLSVLRRLASHLDSYENDNPVELTDPNLRRFPFVYAVEVGNMALSDAEVKSLREYLLAGGFLFVDDFWGGYQWQNFELNIRRVLPEYQIVDLPLDHPLFHTYYEIKEILQVPVYTRGCSGGPYWEQADDTEPRIMGISDEKGRLLVVISYNSDMGDAWEWMELACYPLPLSTYAYEFAVNAIIYSMSH